VYLVCLVGAGYPPTLLKANPVEKYDGDGTLLGSWRRSLTPRLERIDQPAGREVLHVMGGENSPRRVLCPWRAAWSGPRCANCRLAAQTNAPGGSTWTADVGEPPPGPTLGQSYRANRSLYDSPATTATAAAFLQAQCDPPGVCDEASPEKAPVVATASCR
jgi:hypothetical protein